MLLHYAIYVPSRFICTFICVGFYSWKKHWGKNEKLRGKKGGGGGGGAKRIKLIGENG